AAATTQPLQWEDAPIDAPGPALPRPHHMTANACRVVDMSDPTFGLRIQHHRRYVIQLWWLACRVVGVRLLARLVLALTPTRMFANQSTTLNTRPYVAGHFAILPNPAGHHL
ncbi:hypothetical protein E4U53_003947, partial [Claviceps sorghi]